MNDTLDAKKISRLTGKSDITLFDTLDSTNTYLKKHAHEKNDGAVVIARKQENGRGRLGRKFVSDENGLYMSLLIKRKISAETALSITTVAAVAVARAIEKHTSRKPLIKWVNDIYIDDKKVCGILTEAKTAENGIIEYAVLGIGVNLHKPKNGIDDSISDIADCVLEDDEYVANELTADIINYFYEYFGKNDYIDEYISRSYLDGKTVSFYENGALLSGRVIGIDKKCSLLVDVNGACHTLLSGEVGLISFNRK